MKAKTATHAKYDEALGEHLNTEMQEESVPENSNIHVQDTPSTELIDVTLNIKYEHEHLGFVIK
eukprot:15359314-Ditylum_brightwellii.AAC.2